VSFAFEIKNESVGIAHAMLLEFDAPEPVKHLVRIGIAGVTNKHGKDAHVSVVAHGEIDDDGMVAKVAVGFIPAPTVAEEPPPPAAAEPPAPAPETPPAPTGDGELEEYQPTHAEPEAAAT
jgi:hypothetical protein